MIADERGNLFFKDRTGDTFRWKGENCSTSEIEAQVSNEAGYRDTVVYGVEVRIQNNFGQKIFFAKIFQFLDSKYGRTCWNGRNFRL